MCVRIHNRDTGKDAESPQELREMLGITDLIMSGSYKTIVEEACLCQIDCEATVKKAGYNYEEIGHDYMDVEIWKAPNDQALPPHGQTTKNYE